MIAVIGLGVAGCSDDGGSSSQDRWEDSESQTTEFTLLTLDPGQEPVSMEALISGNLGVNAQDCVTLDDHLLVAPAGSTVARDGKAVVIQGYGDFAMGAEVSGATGGYLDDLDRATSEERECLTGTEIGVVVIH